MDPEIAKLLEGLSPEDAKSLLAEIEAEDAQQAASVEIGQASPEMEKAVGFKFGDDVGALDSFGSLLDRISPRRVSSRIKLGEAAEQGPNALIGEELAQAGHPTENVLGMTSIAGIGKGLGQMGMGALSNRAEAARGAKEAAQRLWAEKEALTLAGKLKPLGGLETAAEMIPEYTSLAIEAAPAAMQQASRSNLPIWLKYGGVGTALGGAAEYLRRKLFGE